MKVIEKAPAKINLGLDTPFAHPDGSEEWEMVMAAVDLADYVEIETNRSGKILVSTDSGFLPNDRRNLAYQAAVLMQQQAKQREGVRITIHKNIPVAAGLGGGSSDAAAVLRGLNQIWQLGLSLAELAKLGLQIDSDVPFCVYSKTARVSGRGEIVTPLKQSPNMWVVLAKPQISVSTPSILRQIDYDQLEHPDIEGLVTAIETGDGHQAVKKMGNVLEPITAGRYPEILQIQHRMLKFGADVAQMSGSGPTVFAICRKQSRAIHLFNSMRGFCNEVYLVRPL